MTKEIIKTVVVFILLVVAVIVVFVTKGNDKMEWGIDFTVNAEEEFNYDIVPDEANGEYKNVKGNRHYALVGKNSDGSYRIYLIHVGVASFGQSNKTIVQRLDNVVLDQSNSYVFITENNVSLKLTLRPRELVISSNLSLGNAALEGSYTLQKSISRFAMSEVQIY